MRQCGVSDGQQGIARVRVLGAVQAVAADGSAIELPSPSQRRLLGLLALHAPRRLRSEWLADVLGVSPGALRTSISRLRTTLGPEVLLRASTGYAVSGEVDASMFCAAATLARDAPDRLQALQQALVLWTGPALEEFTGEPWAEGEITRLTEIHADTVDEYADELISARRPAEAVAALSAHVERYPYRDRSRGLLIRALAAAGRQADALRAFQIYRRALVDELGTEPSPEVVRIERRVATGWDGFASEPVVAEAPGVVTIPPPTGLMRSVDFVGRRAELELLTSEAALAATGGLRSVIIGGEPGIGKTALLAAFCRTVASTANVLYGRCDETGVPFEPFRGIIGWCVEHAPIEVLVEHVTRCGGELVRICPRLAQRVATAPSPTRSDDAVERFLVFEAAADLINRMATSRPLVLMVDDLQWAEPTALLLLRHLGKGLADAHILLVVSRRDPGEPVADEVRLAVADLERGLVKQLPLAGLDDAELSDLVSATVSPVPAPDLTVTLREKTAGNPLYACQLIRHWTELDRIGSDDVPPNLRDIVWSRVRSLGDDTASVLAAASVVGEDIPEDVLVDMVDTSESTVRRSLDAAIAAGLLVDQRTVRRSVRFAHQLVADALYSDLGSSRRAGLHARAAHILEKGLNVIPPDVVVQLARHCALGGLPEEALDWSVSAGDHAFTHLAPIEAAHHYRVAVDAAEALNRPDDERADLVVRLGDAQHRAGDAEALRTLARGATLARRSGQHQALIRAALAADRGFMRVDPGVPEYLAIVDAAVAAADPADISTFARLVALLARSLMYTPNDQRRLALAHQALELTEASNQPTLLAEVAPAVLSALWAPGTSRLRGEIASRALAAAEASGDPGLEFSVRLAAYHVAVEAADPIVATHSLARMRTLVRNLQEPRLRWTAGIIATFEATMAARLDDAEALATANLELGMQIGQPDAFAVFAGQFFALGTFAGRHAELLPLVEQSARDNPDLLVFRLAHGIVCAATGREEVARQVLLEGAARGFGDLPHDNLWMTSVIGYAVLAIELADVDAAASLLPLITPYASEVAFNGATSQGPVAAYVGKLASLLGLYDLAEDHLRVALDTATSFGWTYHRATTLFALAQVRHRRLGTLDAEGQAWLCEASDLCQAGSFRSWIPQIDALAAG
jgi:DNA-binding SARP family transcriptional activator